jgi:hypothetical protein
VSGSPPSPGAVDGAELATLTSEREWFPDSIIEINQRLYERGWTDGLPVIPPTEEAVRWMLGGTDRDPAALVAVLPPAQGEATVEKIAINAVMAGCRPEYLPIVITAIECVAEERLNLSGRQTTTHPGAPLIIVNGPLAHELAVNAGFNVFGQGWRANATIGRALRLCLMNIGGGIPGKTDRATHGHPGKYSYCIAENEAANPWEPLHVERGCPRESSAVTVIWGEAPHNINDQRNKTAAGVLRTAASVMATLGGNGFYRQGEALLVLSPEHAATIAGDGWTKDDVRRFLFEQARERLGRVKQGGIFGLGDLPRWIDQRDDDTLVPIVTDPRHILIVVAGGPGRHSMAVLTAGSTWSVTRPVRSRDGSLARAVGEFGR